MTTLQMIRSDIRQQLNFRASLAAEMDRYIVAGIDYMDLLKSYRSATSRMLRLFDDEIDLIDLYIRYSEGMDEKTQN